MCDKKMYQNRMTNSLKVFGKENILKEEDR